MDRNIHLISIGMLQLNLQQFILSPIAEKSYVLGQIFEAEFSRNTYFEDP